MFFRAIFIYSVSIFLMSSASATEKIVFIGDSLTEGYSLDPEFSYPSLIQKKLLRDGHDYKVINGGVSGSTTASGMSRLKWFLKSKPRVLVLALGANDGLRGIKLVETEKNLKKIIEIGLKNKMKIILAGMRIPPNYGASYTKNFKEIFPRLVKKYKIGFIPFLLKGVAGVAKYNIQDGIHPNAKGYEIVSENVYVILKDNL